MGQILLWIFAAVGGILLALLMILGLASLAPETPATPAPDTEGERLNAIAKEIDQINKRAIVFGQQQKWDLAIRTAKQSIELCEKEGFTDLIKRANTGVGGWCIFNGDFEQAVRHLSNGAMPEIDLPNRAIAHYSLENYAECLEDCLDVARRGEITAPTLWLRGLARIKLGDRSLGMADFKKAAEMDKKYGMDYKEDHHGYYFRGLAYGFVNKKEKSMADMEKALEIAVSLKDSYYLNAIKMAISKLSPVAID